MLGMRRRLQYPKASRRLRAPVHRYTCHLVIIRQCWQSLRRAKLRRSLNMLVGCVRWKHKLLRVALAQFVFCLHKLSEPIVFLSKGHTLPLKFSRHIKKIPCLFVQLLYQYWVSFSQFEMFLKKCFFVLACKQDARWILLTSCVVVWVIKSQRADPIPQ